MEVIGNFDVSSVTGITGQNPRMMGGREKGGRKIRAANTENSEAILL